MCLRFAFLLTTRVASWLRLSRRKQAWQTAEILILRHQLAILQRRQPRRPRLNWADRALLATLLGLMPKARRRGLRLLVTAADEILGTYTRRTCGRPARQPQAGRQARRFSGSPPHRDPGDRDSPREISWARH